MRLAALPLVVLVPLFALACGGAPQAQVVLPNDGHDTTALARCKASADHDSPLVTEWPASSKARLESRLRDGAVAVAYSGCEMRIVDACKPKGTYAWSRTTLATDATTIRNDDDLYAKLPLGAASLSGELKASGSLEVRTTVAGQMKLVDGGGYEVPDDASCRDATHVVTALSVGAFKLLAGGSSSAGGSAGIGNVGIGGSSAQTEEVVRSAGDPAHCEEATDEAPSGSCSSPIQIFLQPVTRAEPALTYVRAPGMATGPDDIWRNLPPPKRSPPSRVPGFVLAGLGLVSAGVGTFFLLHASSEKSSIANGGFGTGSDIDSAASSAATGETMGWLLLGSAVTCGLLSLPFFLASSGNATVTTGSAQ